MQLLEKLKALGVITYPGLDIAQIEAQESLLGAFPKQLKQLYVASNGIDLEWFKIYPVENRRDIKRTWNSISRANNPEKSKYLHGETEFLSRFLIFAELSGPDFAVIDRNDSSLWYSKDEKLNQLDIDLFSFIETVVEEVRNL